jgi:hypothetical protein
MVKMHGVTKNVNFDIQDVSEAYFNKKKYDFLIILIVDNAPICNPTISECYEGLKVLFLLPNTQLCSER